MRALIRALMMRALMMRALIRRLNQIQRSR